MHRTEKLFSSATAISLTAWLLLISLLNLPTIEAKTGDNHSISIVDEHGYKKTAESQNPADDLLVDCDWLYTHLKDENIRVIDVSKSADSYEQGHIPRSIKIDRHRDLEDYTRYPPVGYPLKRQFKELMKKIGISNDTIVVAYDDNRGIYASRFIFLMQLYGHDLRKLKLLNGGKKAWVDKGLLLEKGEQSPMSKAQIDYQPAERRNDFLTSWQEIYRKKVQTVDPDMILLDVRTAAEFDGIKIRCVRGGHIPGALHLELASVVTKDDQGRWNTPKELKKILLERGITPDKNIVLYCHSGDRSAQAFIILKDFLGYPNVKIYENAWVEWADLQALPVETDVFSQ